jgi:hypothetical protein
MILQELDDRSWLVRLLPLCSYRGGALFDEALGVEQQCIGECSNSQDSSNDCSHPGLTVTLSTNGSVGKEK